MEPMTEFLVAIVAALLNITECGVCFADGLSLPERNFAGYYLELVRGDLCSQGTIEAT